MKTIRILDLARIIRSKNSGPFELTLDIFFKSAAVYRRAKREHIVDERLLKRLYGVSDREILGIVYYDPVRAVKATIARPVPSGSADDTDVYGAQQHMPLAMARVAWE